MCWLEVSVSNTHNLPLTVYKTHVSPTIQITGNQIQWALLAVAVAGLTLSQWSLQVCAMRWECLLELDRSLSSLRGHHQSLRPFSGH